MNNNSTTFDTIADARAAGWIEPRELGRQLPAGVSCRDASGPNARGYSYEVDCDADAREAGCMPHNGPKLRSVTIWFDREPNRLGQPADGSGEHRKP